MERLPSRLATRSTLLDMASASPLKDIDERFLQCSICMDQLKEPKHLPCLHRYCRSCLKRIVAEKGGGKLQCPTCRETHDLPKNGVDGLKTDFHTNNLVEFVQLHNSARNNPERVCIGCTKEVKVTAYCFKCCDFLCQGCYEFHMTSMIVKDHRQHTICLSEVASRNLTIEKLSEMKLAPRCRKHPEKVSELCCKSCNNMPICVPCTYGLHRGHDLQEVSSLAVFLRGNLGEKLNNLMVYQKTIYATQERLEEAPDKLAHTVAVEKTKRVEEFARKERSIKSEMAEKDKVCQNTKKELKELMKSKEAGWKRKLEEEVRKRHEEAGEVERQMVDRELTKLDEVHKRNRKELEKKLDAINKEIKEAIRTLQNRNSEQAKRLEDQSQRCNTVIEKFRNVTEMAANILAAKHD